MTKEALKLALEALENHCGNYKLDDAGCERWNKAVAAINDALAQTQEPVGVVHHKLTSTLGADYEQVAVFVRPLEPLTKLYTTPPKRPWVGLTDEDIALIDWESLATKKDCARAIEAKLKEKNT